MTAESIAFSVKLPPVVLRANNRAHWSKRKKAADAYAWLVWYAFIEADAAQFRESRHAWVDCSCHGGWERARVTYTWHYCGVQPDPGNMGGNTKYLQDIICVAPKLGIEQAMKYKRTHLGLVENDRNIEPVYVLVDAKHRNLERVEVLIERLAS